MFTLNVGGFDRILRIVLGIGLLVAGLFVVGGAWGVAGSIVGLILLATGLIGWCPLYLPFKFSTRKS